MTTANNATTILSLDQVLSVYSGRNGKCCCGCAGKHSYRSDPVVRAEASANRGYAVADDEVSDRMVKRVLNIVNVAVPADKDVDDTYVATVVGERLYIVYLRKAKIDTTTAEGQLALVRALQTPTIEQLANPTKAKWSQGDYSDEWKCGDSKVIRRTAGDLRFDAFVMNVKIGSFATLAEAQAATGAADHRPNLIEQ